ncbi:MAG TPA: hypothetical protein VN317_08115 [Candidatus Methanoperedens sp.]|nr:hypothetical protein [Candidatus Methanoperedens sp.]
MRTITVKCPKCRGTLEVDAGTGAVLRHEEEPKAKPGADFFGTRLRELEEDKARRAALVEHGREREKTKQGEFDKLFSKVKEEGASGAPAPRPVRDVDLD